MNSSENVTGGQKRNIDSLEMEDNTRDDDLLNNSEPIVKKHKVSCFENLHQSIRNSNLEMEYDTKEKNRIFFLVINYSAGGWSCDQVMDYVREELGESALLVNDFRESDSDFQVKLKFKTQEQRSEFYEKLKIKQEEGKLCVDTEDINSDDDGGSDSNTSLPNRDVKTEDGQSNISIDVWDVNPNTLYGLKEEFLRTLDITPPLTNWVFVTNFRCDKSELKEVLELAGHVVACSVVTVGKRYANVMYSHPLEAVQAISMLNGQTLYGQILQIKMDTTSEYWKVLPKGLSHLGPGLGKYGKPVRDVARQYERFLSGKSTQIETKIFISEESTDLLKEIIQSSVSRPESGVSHIPDLSLDTQDGKTKDMSPKNHSESNNQTTAEHSDIHISSLSDAPYIHNRPITDCSPPGTRQSSYDSLTDSASEQTHKESEPKDTPGNMNVNKIGGNGEMNIPMVQPVTGLNLVANQQVTNLGPNFGANGQMTNMRPYNTPRTTINVLRNFGPIGQGQRYMGVQNMQGAFGVRQVPMSMGSISRPMGIPNLVSPLHQQGVPPIHANSGLGNQTFVSNQMRSQPSLGPFRSQIPNSNAPRNLMQAPIMRPNASPRPSGSHMQQQQQQQSIRPLEIYRGINAFSLKIINIPSTIKLGVLCDKLSEFGQVTGLEFVSAGCASVKFALADEAERCFSILLKQKSTTN